MTKLKGVIMAAGYGTRFFPITKSIPKEMLPIINKPAIDFILDEFQQAGIEDVIVITHRKKKCLEDYLDLDVELETFLSHENKLEAKELIQPRQNMRFTFIRQREMKGSGDALLLVEEVIGNNPFILAFPDDIVLTKDQGLSEQLIQIYEKNSDIKAILACESLKGDVFRFGVVDPGKSPHKDSTFLIEGIIEKPPKGTEPSQIISIGRYLLTPAIFDILKSLQTTHTNGEFYLTGAFNHLAQKKEVLSYLFEGDRLDIGEPESYITSLIHYIKNYTEYQYLL